MRILVRRCLVKDRRQRIGDISAALLILSELDSLAAPSSNARTSRSRTRQIVPAAVAAIVSAIVVAAGAWALWPRTAPGDVSKFSITLPEGQSFSGSTRQVITISRDGRQIAYIANRSIYVRSIGELDARPVAEADVGGVPLNPMFSPDGDAIAFFVVTAGGRTTELRRAPSGGGPVATLAVTATPCGATWSPDGVVFAVREGIFRVPASGGTPVRIVSAGSDEFLCSPWMLPDGRTMLFTVASGGPQRQILDRGTGTDIWDKARVMALSLIDGTRRLVIDGGSDARYVPTGHLLYALAGTMYAAPFDVASLTVTGAAAPVVPGVRRSTPRAADERDASGRVRHGHAHMPAWSGAKLGDHFQPRPRRRSERAGPAERAPGRLRSPARLARRTHARRRAQRR